MACESMSVMGLAVLILLGMYRGYRVEIGG